MNTLGPVNALYPMPTTLVGATVNGKPNFLAVAHVGILTHTHLSIGLGKIHYSNAGIHENKTFSTPTKPIRRPVPDLRSLRRRVGAGRRE